MGATRANPVDTTLSQRELDAVSLLVRGSSNTEIAASMGISERTVYALIDSIKQKLGVSNRAELLRYVREHGLK
jgi:DNA-binding CsgD family transcriptional regulator